MLDPDLKWRAVAEMMRVVKRDSSKPSYILFRLILSLRTVFSARPYLKFWLDTWEPGKRFFKGP